MISRRRLLQYLPSVPFVGGLFAGSFATGDGGSTIASSLGNGGPIPGYRDYFAELGLRTFINAAGTLTALSGSLMPDEVVQAYDYARREYVRLDDIQDNVGERIASMLGVEYATVTTGAFGAMTIGTAGVLAGMDEKKVARLPDTTGMKDVVIKVGTDDIGYIHAILNTGAKVIEVTTLQELEDAIDEQTAMLFLFNAYNNSEITPEQLVAVGKKHGIPTFNDIAADVPPVENLWKYSKMGFDLVAVSGGKGLRGPQSAGLLLGRRDLIQAARLHTPPRGATIGRGMKVNKEEVLAMMVALEWYLAKDHEQEWKQWESQIQFISDTVKSVPGTGTEYHVPEIANHVPTLRISWDQNHVKITPDEAKQRLREGHPSIETGGGKDDIGVSVWMMRPGEVEIVAYRIRDVLREAVA